MAQDESSLPMDTLSSQPVFSDMPDQIRHVFARATCLYAKPQVDAAFDRMAQEMNAVLSQANPLCLCVVVGGIIPMGHLLLRLDFPLEVDYVHVTRYSGALSGQTQLTWKATPEHNLSGRIIVIVDDILDGGLTMAAVVNYCKEHGASAVYSAVLVDKQAARLPGGLAMADFTGLRVQNHYVFGYGMDYKGYLRNAPGIYMVAPEDDVSES